jgi:hypothetical protein
MDAYKNDGLDYRTGHALRGLTRDIPVGGFVIM